MPYRIQKFVFEKSNISLDWENQAKEWDYFVVPVFEKPKSESNDKSEIFSSSFLEKLNGIYKIFEVFSKEEFQGKYGSSFLFPSAKETSILFVGLGTIKEILYNPEHKISRAILKALQTIKKKKISKMGFDFESIKEFYKTFEISFHLRSLLTNILIAFEEYTYHSLEAKEISKEIEELKIFLDEDIPEEIQRFSLSVLRARANTKDLVNMPSNTKTTLTLVEKAKSLNNHQLKIDIIDDVEWIKTNMPCFYMVAKGSLASDPPKWIRVEYTPKTEIKHRIALLGKSIIFDTGGYQVKPDNYMNTMKADMTGGASVLSIIEEVANLQIPYLKITAYCPVTANKIDSDAMLPDSIVTSHSGKRVEIRHTDAEGRLTLIDAISIAEKEENDIFIIIATLTGSAARAVGPRIALMSTRRDKRKDFEQALEEIGEPYQSLEIEDDDYEDIKSKLDGADINNIGNEKYRGAQTAASFIFSGLSSREKVCFHLDIAGGDVDKEEKATGIAIKGVLNYLWNLAQSSH
ncbi:MAG: hypothetical protein NZ853_01595 [Leptospiraceae bacterium]|nr:hypothetical protein [Leptospiraceae bacterium]MDW7976078.1 M17 family peptidase N-terminal domain-containing protein [Leptospiraceae bacterium]